MNWNRLSGFKLPYKYKRFNYIPRYYDERQERLDQMEAKYSESADPERRRDIKFKANLQDNWGNAQHKSQAFKANLRLLLILAILLFGVYYLFERIDLFGEIIKDSQGK